MMTLPAPIKASADVFKQFRKVALKKKSEQAQELKRQAERELQKLSQEKERFVTTYAEILFYFSLLCFIYVQGPQFG